MKQKRRQIDHIMAKRGQIFDSGLNNFLQVIFPLFRESHFLLASVNAIQNSALFFNPSCCIDG